MNRADHIELQPSKPDGWEYGRRSGDHFLPMSWEKTRTAAEREAKKTCRQLGIPLFVWVDVNK